MAKIIFSEITEIEQLQRQLNKEISDKKRQLKTNALLLKRARMEKLKK